MPLILGDVELDFRKLEHLVPDRFGVVAREVLPAPSAFAWIERVNFVAVFCGNQSALMTFVSRLSAAFAFLYGCLFCFVRRCFFSWRCCCWWIGISQPPPQLFHFGPKFSRFGSKLFDFCFQLLDSLVLQFDLSDQSPDNRLSFRRLTRDDLSLIHI